MIKLISFKRYPHVNQGFNIVGFFCLVSKKSIIFIGITYFNYIYTLYSLKNSV